MESEKVKEIKKALEQNIKSGLGYEDNDKFCNIMFADILTLINELESDKEKLNECYKVKAYDKLRAENKQLKDRIAELEKGNEALSFAVKQGFNDCQAKTLKQFAEKLKEKLFDLGNIVNDNDIDETLKECING